MHHSPLFIYKENYICAKQSCYFFFVTNECVRYVLQKGNKALLDKLNQNCKDKLAFRQFKIVWDTINSKSVVIMSNDFLLFYNYVIVATVLDGEIDKESIYGMHIAKLKEIEDKTLVVLEVNENIREFLKTT